ncbi:MAG TPA: ABC transporter permease [Bryobacteraceae bacterium]|nr:ABC transporter permease [Bryobacteraceae bacterium]
MLQDLRYALRALRGTPAFAAVAILSLALGIGANTAIFSLINSLILKTLPVAHPEQLLQVTRGKDDYYTNPIWEQLRDRQDVFSGIFALSGDRVNLAAGGEARYADLNFVSGQFFETLGLHSILGRTLSTADDKRGCPGTAVLSQAFWRKEYGARADVIGKTISLDNHPFEIVGVLPPGFTGVGIGTAIDLYTPVCSEKILRGDNSVLDGRTWWWMKIIGRPSVSRAQATTRLKTLAPEIFKATLPPNMKPEDQAEYLNNTFDTIPVANGISGLRTEYQRALTILMVITGMVLLIACANVANLLLARSAARQREIAIRIAMGLRRGRLMRQLLTESLVLSLTGAALGIFFAQWGARLLVRFLSTTNDRVSLDLTIDLRVLAFTAGVAILTGLLFGLAPAWKGTRVDPQSAMKANARGVIEGSRFGLGKALVVAQVALSLLLVVGAGLMLSTFFKLETLDTGFNRDRILLASVDLRNYPKIRVGAVLQEMLDRLRALPGVRSASASSLTPISGWRWSTYVRIEGYTPKSREDSNVWFNSVTGGFFETLGTGFLAGRDFNAHDTLKSPPVAIVNETLAKRFFAGENPIGKRYRTEDGNKLSDPVEIIGVVKDAKYRSLRDEIPPTAYLPSTQGAFFQQQATLEVRTAGAPTAQIPGVKSAIAEINRDISVRFTTLSTQIDESLTRERLLATLSGFFGTLALLLAIIGLYGVMSYNVARRRNEIGIRMALGAEQSRVLRMVLREVAILIGVGLAIGLAAALATTRLLESFLYGIKSTDPLTLSAAAAVLALVAATAGYVPARRASRQDPMAALREE